MYVSLTLCLKCNISNVVVVPPSILTLLSLFLRGPVKFRRERGISPSSHLPTDLSILCLQALPKAEMLYWWFCSSSGEVWCCWVERSLSNWAAQSGTQHWYCGCGGNGHSSYLVFGVLYIYYCIAVSLLGRFPCILKFFVRY